MTRSLMSCAPGPDSRSVGSVGLLGKVHGCIARLRSVGVCILPMMAAGLTLGGCSGVGGDSILSNSTPLLSDFRTICLDGGPDVGGGSSTAAHIGAKLVRKADFKHHYVEAWQHQIKGHSVSILLDGSDVPKIGETAICTVSDNQDGGRSVVALEKWLGVDHLEGNFREFTIQLTDSQHKLISSKAIDHSVTASQSGALVKLEVSDFGSLTIINLKRSR